MSRSKIIINGETYMDLTSDTVTASALLNGVTAHDRSGASITGSLTVVTYYTGTSDPPSTLNNGDIYLKVVS